MKLRKALVYAILLLQPAITMAQIEPGDRTISLRVGNDSRQYRLHVPPCYDGCTPLPLILVFHGMSANARLIQRLTELDATADKYGFMTAYPDGTGFALLKGFKAGAAKGRLEQRKPSDVQFIHAMLDDLQERVCLDTGRVYATGLSNGAMMCYRLAVEMPNRIAAIAPVSGGLGTETCLPSCPISVMHFHGTCDNVLPYLGPKKGLVQQHYYAVPKTIQLFAEVANCPSATTTALRGSVDDGTQVCVHRRQNNDTGIEVILVEIKGGGHQWPQKPLPLRYLGKTTHDIDANEMMVCFFLRHRLGNCGCGASVDVAL